MATTILSQSQLDSLAANLTEYQSKFDDAFSRLKSIYQSEAEFLGAAPDAINSAINNYDYKHITQSLLVAMQAHFFDPKLLHAFTKVLLDILDLSAMIAGQLDVNRAN